MKILKLLLIATMSLMTGMAHAEDSHKKWINIESMSSPVFHQAQTQIARVGRTDTSTASGKKASRLIGKGKQLQKQIMDNKDHPVSRQQMEQMQFLIMQMDQAAGKPANGTQGACFQSCDDAYGSGFGGGKGWNRFWCKASCFKVNVNVGGSHSTQPPASLSGGNSKIAPVAGKSRTPVQPRRTEK